MNIGVPKERRTLEFRVGMAPAGVQMLTQAGHTCYVEHEAGLEAGFSDQEYEQAGARIVYSGHEVFGRADLLVKIARPLDEEMEWLRPGTIISCFFHPAAVRQEKIKLLQEMGLTIFPYEQIRRSDGTAPVRKPFSQIGATLAAQIGARLLQNNSGGKGILLGGIASVPPAEVVIIGAGTAGQTATKAFVGMGAKVTVLDISMEALQRIYERFPNVVTMLSYPHTIARACAYADLVVGAILVPGERPPIVVTNEMVRSMKPRSVIMDICIDEGGCVETSRPTTHEQPTFLKEGIIHYCVPNIGSVVARTSTHMLLNAAFSYILEVANKGAEAAVCDNPDLERGVAILNGECRHMPYYPIHATEPCPPETE